MIKILVTTTLIAFSSYSHAAVSNTNSVNHIDAVYQKNCASCHNANRLGGMGPALLPANLKRLRKNKAIKVIAEGRALITFIRRYQRILHGA